VLTVLAGAWLLLRGQRAVALLALVCAVLTTLAYLVPLTQVDQALDDAGADSLGIQATTLTGAGFWLGLIGAIVAGVGALMRLVTARKK
jgi:hypothetical protein